MTSVSTSVSSAADAARAGETGDERAATEILKDIFEHTQQLAKQELKLAGAELDQKIRDAKADLIAPLLGLTVAYAGVLALLAGVILLLAQAMPAWAAALIVGVVTMALGYALLQRGRTVDPKLERVPPNLHADVQTIKEAIK